MSNARGVIVVANDVVPGSGLPVAAPGLRAWGLAEGLRAHGHQVTLAVMAGPLGHMQLGPEPPPMPRDSLLLKPGHLAGLVATLRPAAVVVTNSNHVAALGPLGDTRLVYDFFAPKLLEASQGPPSAQLPQQLEALRREKVAALRRSSAVIVNGLKKMDYVESFLAEAGMSGLPTRVVNMPLAVDKAGGPGDGPVHALVAGYIQPWSLPGDWADLVVPHVEDGSIVLHLLVNQHWGGGPRNDDLPVMFQRLLELDGVHRHGIMEYGDFRAFTRTCHVSLDVFAHNPERELAMVTRTAVALSCGLPVLHVPFTETAAFVRDHDAGWLVAPDDHDAIASALTQIATDRDVLEHKRAGAEQAGREVFLPEVAVAPLLELLEDL